MSALLRRGLFAVALLISLLCGCKSLQETKWDGIPEHRICAAVQTYDRRLLTCIADNKVYVCIWDEDYHVTCTRDTVAIQCTNIVNVETVCPGKP